MTATKPAKPRKQPSASKGKYLVGIDLGTTHTVVAYAAPGSQKIQLFPIEQLVALGEVAAQALLPSARYHAAKDELAANALQLPWPAPFVDGGAGGDGADGADGDKTQNHAIIGRLARQLGAQVPGRLVTSAKSWLSHPTVDRQAPILPWGAPTGVAKISPVAASASYLAHVRSAWNHRFPKHPLEQQDIVLTIPASFDESARALTLEAAQQAGLPSVPGLHLVEEPQAAFYDWLYRHRQTLKQALANSQCVLVVDVGGGTTDFSLIEVGVEDDEPKLTRIGVGNHLMLGGDNMDLALAHLAETSLQQGSASKLSGTQLAQLVERCRVAKEQLLAADAPDHTNVTILGGGSKLIGGSRTVSISKAQAQEVIVEGFMPQGTLAEGAQRKRSALLEFGLPYASDAAITRHLASFLQQHPDKLPDTLLLNGGVFRAPALAERLQQTLNQWCPSGVRLLQNDHPDAAVAYGAVAYALARQGLGPRIGGGAARSYYLLLDRLPGPEHEHTPARAICLLKRGTEPGHEIALPERKFALRVGQPVRFHLLTSTHASGHEPGSIIDIEPDTFEALPPIAVVLPANQGKKQEIPVELVTTLTEVGTLEVHCVSAGELDQPAPRWRLEFQLRKANSDSEAPPALDDSATLPPRWPQAEAQIERIFGKGGQQVPAKEVKALRVQLEQLLGNRERWSTPLLRHMFDALWARMRSRRRSVEHERAWLNLVGYCLRPGFGYPLDDWRIQQCWTLIEQGVQFGRDTQVCSEWWTLWRRIAGGLDLTAQLRLLDDFALNVQGSAEDLKRRPPNSVDGSADDMLRLGASLERIPAAYKIEIGAWVLKHIDPSQTSEANSRYLWALARLGARQPFYDASHEVVDSDTAALWLAKLFEFDWRRHEAAAFASAHLARLTGDRVRDLPPELREQIVQRLKACNAPQAWIIMVSEVVQLDEASQRRILGETLPPGLKLLP